MHQTQYSGQQRRDAFRRRREARLYDHLNRLRQQLDQASVHARQQQAQAAQPPPVAEPDDAEIVDGVFVVIGSDADTTCPQLDNERLKALRQAVYRQTTRIIEALGLVGVLFFLKLVQATNTPCPRCQKLFGRIHHLGEEVCPCCGFSIKARR